MIQLQFVGCGDAFGSGGASMHAFMSSVVHLSYAELLSNPPLMHPKRLILTHMNDDMLAKTDVIPHQAATDG
jgi:hypothetical protein